MKFYTQYDRPEKEAFLEGPFEETKTVQSGWMPLSVQVKRLVAAGLQLQAYREAVYDFAPGVEVPDDANDPTRRVGYDLADASTDRDVAIARLREQARISRQEAANLKPGVQISVKEVSGEPDV